MMSKRVFTLALAVLAFAPNTNGTATAQSYPARPVRFIVPFPAGGATDVGARVIAEHVSRAFGQQVYVENRSGANGSIGIEAAAKSAPDGYTVLVATDAVTSNPHVYTMSTDPLKDLLPVIQLSRQPIVLAAHPSLGVNTLQEFVAYVRQQPNKINYSAPVFGGLSHLTMVLFLKRAGLEMIPVGYKGGSAPMTDLLGGHVPVYFALLSDVVPHATSGAVRLLAVSSDRRMAALPTVPTVSEAGYPGFKA